MYLYVFICFFIPYYVYMFYNSLDPPRYKSYLYKSPRHRTMRLTEKNIYTVEKALNYILLT